MFLSKDTTKAISKSAASVLRAVANVRNQVFAQFAKQDFFSTKAISVRISALFGFILISWSKDAKAVLMTASLATTKESV